MAIDPQRALQLAQLVLTVHFAIAAFVVFGMIAIPLGARLSWPWVASPGWRIVHAAVVAVIAIQKLVGQTCFLSVWEFRLLDEAGAALDSAPALHRIGMSVMHWNMPDWFFAALYSMVLLYVAALWVMVPPRIGVVGLPIGRL